MIVRRGERKTGSHWLPVWIGLPINNLRDKYQRSHPVEIGCGRWTVAEPGGSADGDRDPGAGIGVNTIKAIAVHRALIDGDRLAVRIEVHPIPSATNPVIERDHARDSDRAVSAGVETRVGVHAQVRITEYDTRCGGISHQVDPVGAVAQGGHFAG